LIGSKKIQEREREREKEREEKVPDLTPFQIEFRSKKKNSL
jgi:hypothetical protein